MDLNILLHNKNIEEALNILLPSDYYSDVEGDDNIQYKLLDSLCLTYKDGNNWDISHYIEIPDIDTINRLENEYISLVNYVFLKEKYKTKPIVDVNVWWPYTTISHTILICNLSFGQLSQMVSDKRHLSDFYLAFYNLGKCNCKAINEISENLLQKISIQEVCSLSTSFEYLGYLKKIISFGFLPTGTFRPGSVLNYISNDKNRVEYQLYFTEYHGERDTYPQATVLLNLQRYLIITLDNIIYTVYNNAYNLLIELDELFVYPYYTSSDLILQITPQHLLVLSNNIFTITQPAYILGDDFKKFLIDKEIKEMKDRFKHISDCEYFKITSIVDEFKLLIENKLTKEETLETFLSINFKAIFGNKYDLIRTQVMLHIDKTIDSKDRRFDILLHNSITNDWEIFELKRASIKMIRLIRDVPQFSAYVISAIAQLRHYRDLLILTETKRYLKEKYNIEYLIPKFFLIVGDDMSNACRKCIDQEKDIVIKTYKSLYLEADKNYNYLYSNP